MLAWTKRTFAITAFAGSITYLVALLPIPTWYFSLGYSVTSTAALAVSWDIMGGKSGYISLGHGACYGLGAYACAMFAKAYPQYGLLGIPLGGLAGAAIAPVIGAISLRLRRLFFAIATLLLVFVLQTVTLNTPATGGGQGITFPSSVSLSLNALYAVSLTILFVGVIIHLLISNSRFGFGLTAIKDNEIAAQAIGVNCISLKVASFSISSFLAGLTGSLYPMFVGYMMPEQPFSLGVSLIALLAPLLGGVGTVTGAVFGGVFVILLQNLLVFTLGGIVYLVVFGSLLALVVMFLPKGVIPSVRVRLGR